MASVCGIAQYVGSNPAFLIMFCGENKSGARIDCETSKLCAIGLRVFDDDFAELHLVGAHEDKIVDRV